MGVSSGAEESYTSDQVQSTRERRHYKVGQLFLLRFSASENLLEDHEDVGLAVIEATV